MYKQLSVTQIFDRVYNAFIDFLSPAHCSYCKKYLEERAVFCIQCNAKLQPVVSITMPITATKSVKIFAAASYQEPIKSLIMAKSWSDSIASVHLGQLIWERTDLRSVPFDFLIPVPLHWTRRTKRGFNQAQEIAATIAKKSGKIVAPIVKRSKRTPFQSVLKPTQRLANVADAFTLKKIDASLYKDKHLVIVDDLLTTGATIRAVAKVLFELKPASITVVVACRVIS